MPMNLEGPLPRFSYLWLQRKPKPIFTFCLHSKLHGPKCAKLIIWQGCQLDFPRDHRLADHDGNNVSHGTEWACTTHSNSRDTILCSEAGSPSKLARSTFLP